MSSGSSTDTVWRATDKQAELWRAITVEGYRYVLYGGAIRGGKTYGGLAAIIALATIYPGSRWAIVRRDLPTLKKTVLPTWDKVVSDMRASHVGDWHRQDWVCRLSNGSEVLLWAEQRERDPDLNRWRGLEVNGFMLDEANELAERTLDKAMERAGSWFVKGERRPPSIVLMTANPCRNWLKQQVYDVWRDGKLEHPWLYIPATPADNPHLPPDYLQNLESLRDRRPAAYARFVLGDWDATDGDLFTADMFRLHDGIEPHELRRLSLVADIAYTAKRNSDCTALGVCGVTTTGEKYWLETEAGKWEPDESVDRILTLVHDYASRGYPLRVYVEAHRSYLELLRQQAKQRGISLDLHELRHAGERKEDRIAACRAGLSGWRFDPGSQWLIDQFLDWSPELSGQVPDDGCDMHAYADVVLRWAGPQSQRWHGHPPRPEDPTAAKIWDARFRRRKRSDAAVSW